MINSLIITITILILSVITLLLIIYDMNKKIKLLKETNKCLVKECMFSKDRKGGLLC